MTALTKRALLVIAATALASGCTLASEIGVDSEAIHEHQGTHLLGDALNGKPILRRTATNAAGVPFDLVSAVDAHLEAIRGTTTFVGGDPELIGARLRTDTGVELRVDKACPHAVPPSGWRPGPAWTFPAGCGVPTGWSTRPKQWDYVITYRLSSKAPWQPLCDASYNRALPVPGVWTSTGAHLSSLEELTFSCYDGVVTKCLNWGYDLWRSARQWDLHLACTRMASADYCANGESNTLDWTPVDVFDLEAPPINPHVPGFSFEAAWHPDTGAVCIARARWQTFPVGGPCPLPDPRADQTARFCEDYGGLRYLVAAGAILFNDSMLLDSGLYKWNDPIAGESFSTSRFVDDGIRGRTPPGVAYDHPAVFEGTVYSPTAPPRARFGTIPLMSYRHPGTRDYFTTTGSPPAGYVSIALEGYIFGPAAADLPATAVPLNSYRRIADGELLTTTASLPGGYVLHRFEGYLLH